MILFLWLVVFVNSSEFVGMQALHVYVVTTLANGLEFLTEVILERHSASIPEVFNITREIIFEQRNHFVRHTHTERVNMKAAFVMVARARLAWEML